AARLVRALAPRAQIVGVEREGKVVAAARRHFGLDALSVEVVCDDALRALARERRRFDLVIEDCFVGRGQEERKPPGFPLPGLALAARRLAPGGILTVNTLDETAEVAGALAGLLPHRLEIRIAGYDNRVLAACERPFDARALRAALARDPVLGATASALALRTRA
ncbi:MAG TPA: hypothetical protein VLC53_19950, partial [Myxococcota bacterium]|nr:hypothetical protein [Myxococcota bacterium]